MMKVFSLFQFFESFAVFGILLGASSIAYSANCNLQLSASNITLTWTPQFVVQTQTVTIEDKNKKECDYAVTFTSGGGSSYQRRIESGANSLRYQLYKDAGLTQVLKDVPDITNSTEYITGYFPDGATATQTVTFYVQIPLDLATQPAIRPAGTYSDSFSVKVWQGTYPAFTSNLKDSKGINISATIQKLIELSLVNSGGAFNSAQTNYSVLFGTLPTSGATQGFDLLVRSNAGFSVSLSSQNNGKLKHSSANSTVDYNLSVNSAPVSLVNSQTLPVQVASGSGQTSLGGATHAMSITTGTTDLSIAGSYQDLITVTIATTE